MTVIIFLLILTVLVFVHELGHFLVAKKSGVRVDEFAIGFPPTIYSKKVGETKYAINIVPFGGYVKIFGEDSDQASLIGPGTERSFSHAKRWKQALILVAGVCGNFLIAWPLFTLSFLSPQMIERSDKYVSYTQKNLVAIIAVQKDSPAQKAGLKAGDEILGLVAGDKIMENVSTEAVQTFIKNNSEATITLSYFRGQATGTVELKPIMGTAGNKVVGISMSEASILKLPFHLAVWEGFKYTGEVSYMTAISLAKFIGQLFTGHADLSQVSGPVGLVGLVGSARSAGWNYIFSFAAIISVNLAVINLVPFPALDGGRLLFVAIESIIRRPIKPKIVNMFNSVGFLLLIGLMIVITVRDVMHLF
jgi:regulator of sigma E protease